MTSGMVRSLAAAVLSMATAGSWAGAQQVIERDQKVTGPRGRSVERDVRIQRGPGYVDRDITIKRPGGTFERDTRVYRGGPVGGGFYPSPGPRGFGPGPRNVFIERDVFIAPPPPPPIGLFGFGFGGPSFNFGFNAAPPLVVAPPPVIVETVPPPTVVVQPPVRYAAPVGNPAVVVADPVLAAMDRLKSHHNHSRRDGALTLGRLGDARGVPALIERLENDWEKEVRVACAWALGEIGDSRAALSLQKASLYDRKKEVKDAAAIAYRKLREPSAAVAQPNGASSSPSSEPPLQAIPHSLEPPPPPMPDALPDAPK